ncbi:hypothetical protein Dda_2011 [Drechslerella dactyloides]|uniref:Uncharacterized protein n=1 Tax=Drechslerella dactyloides TaxID=74499 RepID=A0AAD6J449_DREDA|nr:hypothetical protein Dda_2011 [Drechslerella dactyloides]
MPPKGKKVSSIEARLARMDEIGVEAMKAKAKELSDESQNYLPISQATRVAYDRSHDEGRRTGDTREFADKFIQYCKDYFSHPVQAGMKGKITTNWQTYTLLHRKNALALWAIYKLDIEFSMIYPTWTRLIHGHIFMLADEYMVVLFDHLAGSLSKDKHSPDQFKTFHITPRNRIQDLPCDLTISLTILAIKQGRVPFKDMSVLEEFINDGKLPANIPFNRRFNRATIFSSRELENQISQTCPCTLMPKSRRILGETKNVRRKLHGKERVQVLCVRVQFPLS